MEPIESDAEVTRFDSREISATNPTEIAVFSSFIHLSSTIIYTVLYSLLFILVYIQLVLILCYKHKRISYQSLFLFLSLIWCALRTTLFSFYFKNSDFSYNFMGPKLWLLFCLPAIIQFVTLALLVGYLSQVVFNVKAKFESTCMRKVFRISLPLSAVIFTTTNIVCATVVEQRKNCARQSYEIIATRVLISELLFFICGLSLAICIYKLTKTTSAKLILETKGTTLCQTYITCALIIAIYVSRAAYNVIVVALTGNAEAPSFNYGWIALAQQGDIKSASYLTFGIVSFVWEFLPTFILVIFFRVKRPQNGSVVEISSSLNSQEYLFNNPHRYDSDDDVFKNTLHSSHDYYSHGGEYHVVRTSIYSSPYGSFHSNYVFRHGSISHSSRGSVSNVTGSPSRLIHTNPLPTTVVINFQSRFLSGHC